MTLRRYSRFTSSFWLICAGAGERVQGLDVGVIVSDGLLSLVRLIQYPTPEFLCLSSKAADD